jgi:DNA-binding NarL/FixJ family response regulator
LKDRLRIAVIDDHRIFREGVEEILKGDDSLDVVEGGSNAGYALAIAARERLDLLLIDVEMPGLPTLDVVRQMRSVRPETAIIVLTMHADPSLARDFIDAGCAGFLAKTVDRVTLLRCVHAAVEQSPQVMLLVDRLPAPGPRRLAEALTSREQDVLRLVADARSNQQIATRLGIRVATVKRHLSNIYTKLGAVSRLDAVRLFTTSVGPAGVTPPPPAPGWVLPTPRPPAPGRSAGAAGSDPAAGSRAVPARRRNGTEPDRGASR